MPQLFDLLSDNTSDSTIESLRKIAKQKMPKKEPQNHPVNKQESAVSSSAILDKLDFVALDLETTGLDNKNDRVIEIGAVRYIAGKAQEEYNTFIDPKLAIPPQITGLTSITNKDVAGAPAFADIALKLQEFIGDLPLCGHQIEFDINFLNEEYKRAALPKVFMKQIDTALLARITLPLLARYTLGFVARTLGVTLAHAHRALDDARAGGDVALILIPKLAELPLAVRAVMAHCAPPSLIRHVLQSSLRNEKYQVDLLAAIPARPPQRLSPRDEFDVVDKEDVEAVFAHSGALSEIMTGYSERSAQTEMSVCVAEALSTSSSLVAEAGTGTGKSLAYLIPAAMFGVKNDCRVLVSTHTRNLQDQLVSKDLPIVKSVVGREFVYSVLKGRGNYLCQKRYRLLLSGELGDFSYRERMGMLPLVRWAQETATGDIEEQNQFNIKWFARVWHAVCAESHSCEGRRCAQFSCCFLQNARQRALGSHVVVINHALFFSELCAESSFLGRLGPIIFDEAHHLESCGHRHLRTEIDSNRFAVFIDMATNLGKSVAKHEMQKHGDAIAEHDYKPIVKRLRGHIKTFLTDAIAWAKTKTNAAFDIQTGYDADAFSQNATYFAIDTALADMQDVLHLFAQECEGKDVKEAHKLLSLEIISLAEAVSQLKADFSYLTSANTEDHVFWCEGNAVKGWIKLCGVPLDVGSILSNIWTQNPAGRVFTSATLSVAGSMSYFRRKVGLGDKPDESTRCETFASPFSPNQAIRCGIRQSPELDSPQYPAYVSDAICKLLGAFEKNILVLFTANAMLGAVYEILKKQTQGTDCTILAQGFSGNRQAVLEEFKQSKRAVLLGADSFWEGVDVPGKACEIVVIPRLPFPVPTHPLTKALCKKIEEEKGESFMSFSVPEAIIKFRQGTGRLIRTQTDRGALVVLDNRLFTKGYGKQFTSSLEGRFIAFDTATELVESVAEFFSSGEQAPSSLTYIPIEEI